MKRSCNTSEKSSSSQVPFFWSYPSPGHVSGASRGRGPWNCKYPENKRSAGGGTVCIHVQARFNRAVTMYVFFTPKDKMPKVKIKGNPQERRGLSGASSHCETGVDQGPAAGPGTVPSFIRISQPSRQPTGCTLSLSPLYRVESTERLSNSLQVRQLGRGCWEMNPKEATHRTWTLHWEVERS